ncbi:MAG: LptF/LptG family permease, partial [Candidatus Pacebacteria bacterium]|nr:LptF/LptG family permease [Candidatus Paceibacterota bacterium]
MWSNVRQLFSYIAFDNNYIRFKYSPYEKKFLIEKFYTGEKTLKTNIKNKKGNILYKNGNFFLVLYDGQIINLDKKNITTFKFSKTEFNLSKFSTKTTTFPKIQELNSPRLLKCLVSFYKNKKSYSTPTFSCDINSINAVSQELYKRTLNSIYILIVSLIA